MRGDNQSLSICQDPLKTSSMIIKKNPHDWRINPNLKQGSCHLTYSLQPDNEDDQSTNPLRVEQYIPRSWSSRSNKMVLMREGRFDREYMYQDPDHKG